MADIDRLEIQVQAQAQKANSELDKLVNRLEKVSSSLSRINASGLKGLANGIDSLGNSMQKMSTVKTADFTRLAKNIEKLGNIDQSKINATASAIRTISNSLTTSTGLTSGATQITDLANSISKLGYKSASNAITNIPLMANALRGLMQTLSTSPRVSQNLINMTNSLANLAQQGSKVRSATNSINGSLKGYSGRVKEASATTRAFTFSLAGLYAKLWAIRRAVTGMWGSVEKSMDYTETINLFQTSFKKIGVDTASDLGLEMGSVASEQFGKAFIDRATDYNKKITEALSLDPDLMMNYQAVFAQMSNSMNLTAASALNISESFTLLGNDIASLWNIDTDVAMKKLQSGLAGQIRPLRELGVDISKTSLEMYAMKYGIEDSVESMSQAAKVQLRWLAIMEQTEVAFGDMAKTIDSPANQLRILQQQWTNLSRSIGNVFLPVVTTILPYINAVVIALRRMIDTFATAVGFELPDYSNTNIYKDITGEIEGMGEEAEGAKEFVDGLKKSLMSFDELNILSEGKNKKGIDLNLGDGYDQLDDAINQKTVSYMAKFNEEMANMQNKAEELADQIQPKLEKFVEWMDKVSPILKGIGGAFVTYKVVTWFTSLATALGAMGPTGIAVVAVVGGLIAIYDAVKKYNKKLIEEDLEGRFGKIKFSMEEIENVAERLTASEYTAKIDVFISEQQKLSEIEAAIQEDLNTLNKLNWKVSVGLALTEGEVAEYKSTIESFIANSEAYIEQQNYVTKLAIEAVIQDGTFKQEISTLVDKYFDGSKGEMARLGKQLRNEMDNALADGIIDANEQKVIDNLIKEISQIQERIASAEFVAKLQTITLDGDLDAESYKKLFAEIQSKIDERSKGAEAASTQILTVVNAQYEIDMENATTQAQRDEIQRKYNEDVNGIRDELAKTKIEISEVGMQFAYDKIKEKWQPELSSFGLNTQGTLESVIQGVIDEGMLGVDPGFALNSLFARTLEAFNTAAKNSGMDKAARTNLETFLAQLEPTSKDNKKLAEQYIATGQAIPKTLSDQLTDEAMLRALAGDADGILYTLGQQLADSPEILTMIANGKIVGSDLDDSIIAGMKSKIPDLKKQGSDLVFDVDKAIKTASSSSGTNNMPGYAEKLVRGYKSAFDKDTSAVASVKSWLDGINTTVKNWKFPEVKIPTVYETLLDQKYNQPYLNGGITIQGRASGGYVNTGEIFASRENGIPEIVGRIGNRTAVMNNDQITTSVASAVKGAIIEALIPMVSTMNGNRNQSTGDVVLVVDGEEIARVVNQGNASLNGRYKPVIQGT